jgi:hypothetical protein
MGVILVAFGIIFLVFGFEYTLGYSTPYGEIVPNPAGYIPLLGSGLGLLIVGGSLIYLNRSYRSS